MDIVHHTRITMTDHFGQCENNDLKIVILSTFSEYVYSTLGHNSVTNLHYILRNFNQSGRVEVKKTDLCFLELNSNFIYPLNS